MKTFRNWGPRESMNDQGHEQSDEHWESVHTCPKCSHAINLAAIDLKAITTGIVSCPDCSWSGPIHIQIVGDDF
jgi:ribosomal protein L37AE/L43A